VATVPVVEELRSRLGIVTSVTDAELEEIRDGAYERQREVCRWPIDHYPTSLRRAIFRRVARECAAKGLPLGYQAGEFGVAGLRGDRILEELEGPWRQVVV
jgi:hypothetical protein